MAEATVIALLLHDTAVRCYSLAADSVLAVYRRKREDCRPPKRHIFWKIKSMCVDKNLFISH